MARQDRALTQALADFIQAYAEEHLGIDEEGIAQDIRNELDLDSYLTSEDLEGCVQAEDIEDFVSSGDLAEHEAEIERNEGRINDLEEQVEQLQTVNQRQDRDIAALFDRLRRLERPWHKRAQERIQAHLSRLRGWRSPRNYDPPAQAVRQG